MDQGKVIGKVKSAIELFEQAAQKTNNTFKTSQNGTLQPPTASSGSRRSRNEQKVAATAQTNLVQNTSRDETRIRTSSVGEEENGRANASEYQSTQYGSSSVPSGVKGNPPNKTPPPPPLAKARSAENIPKASDSAGETPFSN